MDRLSIAARELFDSIDLPAGHANVLANHAEQALTVWIDEADWWYQRQLPQQHAGFPVTVLRRPRAYATG